MRPSILATAIAAALLLALLATPLRAGDGAVDSTFGTSGVFTYAWDAGGNNNDFITDLVAVPGALFVVGYGASSTGDTDWFLLKLDEAGNVVATGSAFFDKGGSNDDFAEAAYDDGKGGLIVAGIAVEASHNDVEICRFDESTLSRDPGFGVGGCREFDLGAGINFGIEGIAPMPNDTGFVVGGRLANSTHSYFFVLRLFGNGNIDPFYGSSFNGLAEVSFSEGEAFLNGLAVDSNLGVLLAGFESDNTTEHLAFAKLTGDGVLDSAFGNSGTEVFSSPAPAQSTCAAYDGAQNFGVGIEEFGSSTSTGRAHQMNLIGDLYYGVSSDVTWDADGRNHPLRILFHGDRSLLVASDYYDSGLVGQVFAGTRFPCLGCSADTSFGASGLAKFQPAAEGLGAGTLTAATEWTGRLVEGGVASGAGNDDWVIVRFTSSKLWADGWENEAHHWSAKQP